MKETRPVVVKEEAAFWEVSAPWWRYDLFKIQQMNETRAVRDTYLYQKSTGVILNLDKSYTIVHWYNMILILKQSSLLVYICGLSYISRTISQHKLA